MSAAPPAPLLELRGFTAAWGRVPVVRRLDLSLRAGEAVALLGRNGTGKTTTIRAIMGTGPVVGGSMRWEGVELAGAPAHRVAQAGIAWVPEGRRVFGGLSVAENLEAGRQPLRAGVAPWTSERVLALFPALGPLLQREAASLSGGEQQMLAIGRALMGQPRLVLLDEPVEGLAPLVARAVGDAIAAMRAEGLAVLLAESGTDLAARLADRALVLDSGEVAWTGPIAALLAEPALRSRLLGVGG